MLAAVSTLPRAGLVMSPSRRPAASPAVSQLVLLFGWPNPPEPPPKMLFMLLLSPPIVHVDDDAGAARPSPAGRAVDDPSAGAGVRSLLRIIFGTPSPAPPETNESPPPYSRAMATISGGGCLFFVGYLPPASSCALPAAVVHFPPVVGISGPPPVVMCPFRSDDRGRGGVAFPLSLFLLLMLLCCSYD